MVSPTVSVWFTAVFLGTGGWALYRLTARAFVDRAAEGAHLLMSLAMIAMTWGWTGGPGSTGGMVQVGLFGLFALRFVAGAVGGRVPSGLHATNAAAMVWMVVAMPALMGTRTAWTTAVTVLFTALLVGTAGVWVHRGRGGGGRRSLRRGRRDGRRGAPWERAGRRLLPRADEPRHGRDVPRHALKPVLAHPVGRIPTQAGTGRHRRATSAHA